MAKTRRAAGNIFKNKRSGKYYARFYATIDGVRMRVCRALKTESRAIAERKLAAILASENPAGADADKPESFRQAAERIVGRQTISSLKDRQRRLRQVAYPCFGDRPANELRRVDVIHVLETAVELGWQAGSVRHLRTDISMVFEGLIDEGLLADNPARGAKIPAAAKRDRRERVRLTDAEFNQLIAWGQFNTELGVMVLTSRLLGGLRTSDLLELQWSRIDWQARTIVVVRPKTESESKFQIPPRLFNYLAAWWGLEGKPREGYLFPTRRGPRKGLKRIGKFSYAGKLRDALWAAGVRRSPDRASCPLQVDTEKTRATDFHSLRRAYVDALSQSGLNAQRAMQLSGHSDLRVHQAYMTRSVVMAQPDSMIPENLPSENIVEIDSAFFTEQSEQSENLSNAHPERRSFWSDPVDSLNALSHRESIDKAIRAP